MGENKYVFFSLAFIASTDWPNEETRIEWCVLYTQSLDFQDTFDVFDARRPDRLKIQIHRVFPKIRCADFTGDLCACISRAIMSPGKLISLLVFNCRIEWLNICFKWNALTGNSIAWNWNKSDCVIERFSLSNKESWKCKIDCLLANKRHRKCYWLRTSFSY